MTRLFLLFASSMFFVLAVGCSMPEGMNADCRWPPERFSAVNVPTPADEQHLVHDIKVAEELAIRHTDALGKLNPLHLQRRRDCETALFSAIAQSHRVGLAEVSQTRKRLDDWRWDPAVHFPVAAFCGAMTFATARRIRRRFPDERAAAIVATVVASVVLGASMVFLGGLWGGVVEMIRVGDTHMSYRAFRLGWRQHSEAAVVIIVLLFWFVVVVCYSLPTREKIYNQPAIDNKKETRDALDG